MRLLTALAGLGKGRYTIQGTERMHERPIEDLLDGLIQLGISAKSINKNDCPPVEVLGGIGKGGGIKLRCDKSSQFLSAILLIAPYLQNRVDIRIIEGPVSKPYIDMTLDVMARYGVPVERKGYQLFKIDPSGPYRSGSYTVEPDASQAGYFWSSAAITGADIKVKGISRDSLQGDIRIISLLESMGCRTNQEQDGIRVMGGPLSGIHADMQDIPDMVPTLAVVAAFAKGTTIIKNVAHLKQKESNRLAAVVRELNKMGIKASCTHDGLMIEGGTPHGAVIETYNDHRIAMSFAMAGLLTPGIDIQDPMCVEKSFPNFWDVFGTL
jgi:3-phosphoshikimate 1-carboxyvinyltransferase